MKKVKNTARACDNIKKKDEGNDFKRKKGF